jgi:hypothetical protein
VTSYTNTKIPFISPKKNGPDPLPCLRIQISLATPFPGQNDWIPAGWTRSGHSPDKTARSRPAGQDLAFPQQDQPDSGLFGRGTGRRGEWLGDSDRVLCFRHAVFIRKWKGHFCLYVLKFFFIYFTIKLMWSHI